MKNFANNTQTMAPDAQDFLGGNYLKKEDLDGPTVVTIEDVRSESVLGASRSKLILSLREFEKPLILNKTNIKRLAQMFGTTKTSSWRGQITLYVEDSVEFGGHVVGGIRVYPAQPTPPPSFENGGYVPEFEDF